MKPPAVLLDAFPPSPDRLFDRARRATDDAMLTEIARADYGSRAAELMAELRPVRDRGIIPSPMNFWLGEVLNLTRNCDPERPNPPPFEPGPTGRRGHQTRLFACAVLLRAEADPAQDGVDTDPGSTLAQSLIGAGVLGEEWSEAIARFLTWRMSRPEARPSSLLDALASLILATRLRSGRLTESDLGTISEWVFSMEAVENARFPLLHAGPPPAPFSVQFGFWGPLVAELRREAESVRDADLRTNLELCGLLLDPGW